MSSIPNKKILVVDDDQMSLDLLRFSLRSQGYQTEAAATGNDAVKFFPDSKIDLVLLDLRLPDMDGMEVMRRVKEISPDTEVIIISGYSSMEKAVEATKQGAFYFVEKPVDIQKLFPLVESALSVSNQKQEIKQLRDKLASRETYEQIVGSSKAMQNVYEIIDSVAPSDANILVIGESGTGKELIANAVHFRSHRANRPFVKVNCAALPKELIESELFGHKKGSFTGAIGDKDGLISRAEGGSLLLDEIGEMPIELQPKMLRVLQERVFTKVGDSKPLVADFRLIAATNREPLDAVREGVLREDLYYRINTITIRVPPLRERVEDIQLLAEHFRKIYSEKYRRDIKKFSPAAYQWLFQNPWKGNVRELQNAVERAVLMAKSDIIQVSDLPAEDFKPLGQVEQISAVSSIGAAVSTGAGVFPKAAFSAGELSSETLAEAQWEMLGEAIVKKIPEPSEDNPPEDIFEKIESHVVKAALERTKNNKQAAANLLGIYRPRLYSMMRKHNLQD